MKVFNIFFPTRGLFSEIFQLPEDRGKLPIEGSNDIFLSR